MRDNPNSDYVFLLWHKHFLSDGSSLADVKLMGVFDRSESAEQARDEALMAPGFSDFPDGFEVEILPSDEVVSDNEESGLSELVASAVLARFSEIFDDSPAGNSHSQRLQGMLRLGTPTVSNLIEEVHQQIRDVDLIDEIEFNMLAQWMPFRPEVVVGSGFHVNEQSIASSFWHFRRQNYPLPPAWFEAKRRSWRTLWAAHKQTLLFDEMDGVQAVTLLSELFLQAETESERAYARQVPLRLWMSGAKNFAFTTSLVSENSLAPANMDAIVTALSAG